MPCGVVSCQSTYCNPNILRNNIYYYSSGIHFAELDLWVRWTTFPIRIETKTHQIVLLQNLHVNNAFLPNILKNHGEILVHVEENRVTHLDATSWISRPRSISRHAFLVLNRVRFFIDEICPLTMYFFPTYSKIKLKYLPMVKKTVSHILTLLVTRLVETRSGNHQPVWLRSVSAPMPTQSVSKPLH